MSFRHTLVFSARLELRIQSADVHRPYRSLSFTPTSGRAILTEPGHVVPGSERRAVPQEKEYGMVEVPEPPSAAFWQKSNVSGPDGNCVEVARTHEHAWVRDSKHPRGPALGLTREEWAAFLVGVQRGEFDRPGCRLDDRFRPIVSY